MKLKFTAVLLVSLLMAIVGLYFSAYVVKEGQQAVITQFGRFVHFTTDAGLHFKSPFIQEVHLLEKRLLPWDGSAENMQTRDKKRIFIDVWARWRVSDVEKFYKAHRTEQNGQKILDDLVNAAVRNVVAQNNLIDVVRSTNDELVYESEEMKELARSSESTRDVVTSSRGAMEASILSTVNGGLDKNNYGMQLAAVRIKRVNYVETVKETVYERMSSERLRIARLYESEAEEAKNRIEGLTRKELDQLEGEMEQKSAEIRGKAEAMVIEMTAEAYGKSPEFYSLLRYLDVYKSTLDDGTRLILTTDGDLFRLLKQMDPDVTGTAAPVGETGR